ncbi:hypothetical protein BDW02DRAFT_573410 [Decorospora gaudefroyi]|uniref:Uncharacterized protein n=1 Tax=Decorospora gaudefroyi TaxID=184978 RepID=A0A6A5K1S9_9PLEO|nr:hypothetical protein BDW02DRAFT_573410 [Decorospora gaudefroyi]
MAVIVVVIVWFFFSSGPEMSVTGLGRKSVFRPVKYGVGFFESFGVRNLGGRIADGVCVLPIADGLASF